MNTMMKLGELRDKKLISLPHSVREDIIMPDPVLRRLFVSELGYVTNDTDHYSEGGEGCSDNILVYCVNGRGWYRIGDRRFELSANQFVILPATNEPISYGGDMQAPWTIYWIHFSVQDAENYNSRFGIGIGYEPRPIVPDEMGPLLWETMYQNLEKGFTKENLSNANLCLYHFIAAVLFPSGSGSFTQKYYVEKKRGTMDIVSDIIIYMKSKLDHILTIREMAMKSELSTSHFSSVFHKTTGMPPMEYFIRLKLEKACAALSDSEMKIKDIASMLGYEDPYYFSRLFKKHLNMSPFQYRVLRSKPKSIFDYLVRPSIGIAAAEPAVA
jgi:AraC-like DNA-binding protein